MQPRAPYASNASTARVMGFKRFYNGQKCARGHVAEWNLDNRCIACIEENKRNPIKRSPSWPGSAFRS